MNSYIRIFYYKRYVEDTIIIYDQTKINEIAITGVNEQLEFKATEEINNSINYLDLTINRYINKIELDIYRKPTNADITIQYTSNHPQDHKQAAFTFYINRMLTLPITDQAKKKEWGKILNTAPKNGFPINIIHNIKKKETAKQKEKLVKKGTANKTNTE
jgi:hypothetical protein